MREAFDEQVRTQRFDPIASAAHRADVSRNSAGFIAFSKIKIGDKVRIRLRPRDQPRDKSALTRGPGNVEKGSDRWSNKVYTVTAIEGYSFALLDSQGRAANRTYRAHELLVDPQDSVDVPDILAKPASQARRARNRVKCSAFSAITPLLPSLSLSLGVCWVSRRDWAACCCRL